MGNWAYACVLASLLCFNAAIACAQEASEAFYKAIRNNDITSVKRLIKTAGADFKDKRGTTPLMYAAAIGSLESMRILLDAGANPNAKNSFEASALLWAAGDLEKVRLLLSKGADVNAKSKIGRTPLIAAAYRSGSAKVVEMMLEKGAEVNVRDEAGLSPLAAAVTADDAETTRILLSKGADPKVKDPFEMSLAGVAAMNRNLDLTRMFIARGAEVNCRSKEVAERVKNGPIAIGLLTPLLLAVSGGDTATVKALVEAGADVNAQDVRGLTPLALAIATDRPNLEIVRYLLAKGADPAIKSKADESVHDWARKYRQPEIVAALGLKDLPPAFRIIPAATTKTDAKSAVEKGVAVLQQVNREFMERGGCVSCHAQNMTGYAVEIAKANGANVNASLEAEQANLNRTLRGGLEQLLLQVFDPPPGVDGMESYLLQTTAAEQKPSLATDALVLYIAAGQRKEGNWFEGTIVRPPMEDGDFTVTAFAIRCLKLFAIPARKAEFDDRVQRAVGWLDRTPPVTTYDRAAQLLGIRWGTGRTPQDHLKALLALQRTDGGWAQTPNLESDAYATGLAMYALHEAGMAASDPAYSRGTNYLLRTQESDGSWHVRTRAAAFQPYFQSGFPHDHDQWLSGAATAWAAIALSPAIPLASLQASR